MTESACNCTWHIIILIYNENVLLDPIQIDGFPADVLRKTCLFILIFKFKSHMTYLDLTGPRKILQSTQSSIFIAAM